ncbi:MAG TPA: S8 family serine peptidase [Verrucomicrobiae bacterium]|nr:S8 family serine peptidase [Verrucomicrobiae bacterium]
MNAVRAIIFCLLFAFCFHANAAQTNSIVWHKTTGRVDADVRGETLWPLLEQIAAQVGWKIYVEPGTERVASAKFKNLPSGDALRMLLGDLNFALVPQTNTPALLYVFTTKIQNATRLVRTGKHAKHVPNELLLRVKPGTDIDALAKMLGAKITGRMDKYGIYRLQFAGADATDSALSQLQNDSDVLDADYNYYFDPPTSPQMISSAPIGPLSLQLNPPQNSGKVIVGLVDTAVQSLGDQLNQFLLKQISIADGTSDSDGITHGTAMAYTLLEAIAQASGGKSSVQILPADVYGGNAATTSWDVALGIQAVVNGGANVVNLSLGSASDSSILDSVIQQGISDGITFFASAGNTPVNTPTFPAAIPGVNDVTALSLPGQIASYANFWAGVDMALPGTSIVYFGSQAYVVQGTSPAAAYATGVFAGTMNSNFGSTAPQIISAMQQKFPVPGK